MVSDNNRSFVYLCLIWWCRSGFPEAPNYGRYASFVLGPPGIERCRVIGLLQGLSADWDYRPTKEEILEMNDPNQPKPDLPEFDGDPNLIRDMIRQQAQQIMEEEVAALIGAALGENNPECTTWRNGYRARAWKNQLHSTNPIERLNREIKRCTDTVGVFPNVNSILRLVGTLLLQQNRQWQNEKHYLDPGAIRPIITGA